MSVKYEEDSSFNMNVGEVIKILTMPETDGKTPQIKLVLGVLKKALEMTDYRRPALIRDPLQSAQYTESTIFLIIQLTPQE